MIDKKAENTTEKLYHFPIQGKSFELKVIPIVILKNHGITK